MRGKRSLDEDPDILVSLQKEDKKHLLGHILVLMDHGQPSEKKGKLMGKVSTC